MRRCVLNSYRLAIPAPLLVIAGALAGVLVAIAARRAVLRAVEPLRTRYFGVCVLLGFALFMPAGLVFVLSAPAWSLMYLTHPDHVPGPALEVGVALSLAASPPAGFALAERLLPTRRGPARYVLLCGTCLLLVVLTVLGRHRIAGVAYYDDFHLGGPILDLTASWLFVPSLLTFAAVLLGVGLVLRSVHRHVD